MKPSYQVIVRLDEETAKLWEKIPKGERSKMIRECLERKGGK